MSDTPESQGPAEIPEVVPERHILPEMPEEQAILEGKAPPAHEPPRFIEPSRPASIRASTPVQRSRPVSKPAQKAKPTQKARRYTLVTTVSALRSLIVTFAAAVIVATIFMWWTSPDFLPVQARVGLAPVQATARQVAVTRTALPTPIWFNRIGVLAGHTGIARRGGISEGVPDPGAVCPDGFFERSVTEAVASQLVAMLRGRGFTVDLLEEWDMRLFDYQAAAFIALHADSCENFGYGGFKSTNPTARFTVRELDERLNECIRVNYSAITGMEFRADNITDNMRLYHAFREISQTTPAVILELGFLSFDRDLLQNQPDRLSQGIVNGLMCFLTPKALATEMSDSAQPAPVSTPTP